MISCYCCLLVINISGTSTNKFIINIMAHIYIVNVILIKRMELSIQNVEVSNLILNNITKMKIGIIDINIRHDIVKISIINTFVIPYGNMTSTNLANKTLPKDLHHFSYSTSSTIISLF